MKTTVLSAAIILLGASALGIFSQLHSWDGVIYISNSQVLDKYRNPAAIHKALEYAQIDGSALSMGSQKRLIEEATFKKENGKISIELGHFVTQAEGKRKVFACDFYEHVDLVFNAEGTATGGEIPSMKVQAPCKVSQDLNKILAISIPVEKILGQKAQNLDSHFDQASTNFHFENMGNVWPKTWILKSVHLYRDNHPNEGILVGPEDIKNIRSQAIYLRW
jgi:hypothetical protein